MSIWLFAAFLVLWGNAVPWLIGASATLPGGSPQFLAAGVLLVAISLLAARSLGVDPDRFGARLAPRWTAAAAIAGAAAAVIGVGILESGLVAAPVAYGPLGRVSAADLARHIAFFLPLGDVVPEEVAFRGSLVGALAGRYGSRAAILGSAAAFALWHGTVVVATVRDTTLGPEWTVPAVAGAFAVLFAGGAALAALRLVSRSLAATIGAHWSFNAVVLVGLYALGARVFVPQA